VFDKQALTSLTFTQISHGRYAKESMKEREEAENKK
jgi:hypothetical protein